MSVSLISTPIPHMFWGCFDYLPFICHFLQESDSLVRSRFFQFIQLLYVAFHLSRLSLFFTFKATEIYEADQ